MKFKNIITKLYIALGFIVSISLAIVMFSNYSSSILEKNNKKRHEINNEIIFFESMLGKHEKYVKEMLHSMIFQTKFTKELNPKKCNFGQWYYKMINSEKFKELPKNIQKDILGIELSHTILHQTGRIIKEQYVSLDRHLKDSLMEIKIKHIKFQYYLKKQIENKQLINRGLNSKTCSYGIWWESYQLSNEYQNQTTPQIKKLFQKNMLAHKNMHQTINKIYQLQKKNQYTKINKIFYTTYQQQFTNMVNTFDAILAQIDKIEQNNKSIRDDLTLLIPPSLKVLKEGLKPYQNYLHKQRDEAILEIEQNSELLDTISMVLTILNIIIIIIVGYWIQYHLVEQIRYLKERYKELQETQTQLVESEKMASLGGMVAGVAHEINTPVGVALTAITHLEDETKALKKNYDADNMSQEDFEEYLKHSMELNKSININLNKAASLVRSFKQVAVDQTSEHDRTFNLAQYINEILQSLHSQLKRTYITIELNLNDKLEIYSNPGAISQILSNFIMNSIIHGIGGKPKGIIKIETIQEDDYFILTYSDNGKGMDKETQEKVYEPFFTTNRENGGSGLGMNIIFNLVTQKLHGTIDLETSPNNGVLFTIKAPLHYKEITNKV